jgi:membrane peptidoglycan carboxypeptidase
VLPGDLDRDVSYALQQVVSRGTGANAQALGRPAAGKTGTATNAAGDVSSSWFVGYTPQMATAVMYVRGDGNDALNGYLPSYFGADYPTRTWTEAMRETLDDRPVEQFPPPANVEPTRGDHRPRPTFTPSPTLAPTPSLTPSPSATVGPTRTVTATPTPTPTATATPTPTPTPSSAPTSTAPTTPPPRSPSASPSSSGPKR